eukprot:scaffold7549_cov111-Isochrysis_galbana.AAC.11
MEYHSLEIQQLPSHPKGLPTTSICRIRGAAKFRPITVTDVQSDGRPLALPGDTHGAPYVCAAVLAIIARQVTSHPHSCEFPQSDPSRRVGHGSARRQ